MEKNYQKTDFDFFDMHSLDAICLIKQILYFNTHVY